MKKPEKCARTIFFDFKRYFEISVLEVTTVSCTVNKYSLHKKLDLRLATNYS